MLCVHYFQEAYEKGIYWPTDSDKFLKVDDLTIILLDSQQVTLTESSLPVFKLLVRRDEVSVHLRDTSRVLVPPPVALMCSAKCTGYDSPSEYRCDIVDHQTTTGQLCNARTWPTTCIYTHCAMQGLGQRHVHTRIDVGHGGRVPYVSSTRCVKACLTGYRCPASRNWPINIFIPV